MNILVAGAGGQLGLDLAPRLVDAGFKVVGMDSKRLDITNREKVARAMHRTKPDIVINCAAYTLVDMAEADREKAFRVNSDGAAILADAVEKSGALLIHISTDFVFDGAANRPYNESALANPLSVYGLSKFAGEGEIIRRAKRHIIIRTSWLYGSFSANFVKTVLRLAMEREEIRVVYDQVGTPTWTGDLAGALVTVANTIRRRDVQSGIYNFSCEGVASWYDFAEFIVEDARKNGLKLSCRTVQPILTHEYPTPARRPAYSVLDKRKFKETFGVAVPHWGVSLREMLDELYGIINA